MEVQAVSVWFELSSMDRRVRDAVEFSPRVEEEAVFDSGIVEMEGCLTVFKDGVSVNARQVREHTYG